MKADNPDIYSKKGLWHAYKTFIRSRITPDPASADQDISYWRDRLFAEIISYFLPCCCIALVPGVVMSVLSGQLLIGIIDLLSFALILCTVLNKKLSITVRKIVFLAVIYILSVALTIFLSLFGPGMIYLLTVCMLTTIILPKKRGYVCAFGNLLTCIFCAILINSGVLESSLNSYGIGAWIAVCSNLVFLSFVVVAVVSHTIEGLEKTLLNDGFLRRENMIIIKDLEHSERRLKQAQALAHLGSWELSFSTGIALWSEEACRIYGLSPKDNIQSYDNWMAYNHPDDVAEAMRIIGEARKTFSNSGFYHRILRNDGSVRHLYSEAEYEFDDEGQPIGLYGIAYDLTELRENEEELRKSNERFELINQAAREAILDWDIVKDVTFWGNGFTEIFGYAPCDYHNHLLSSNIHPEDREEALGLLQSTLDNPDKNMLYREFRFLRADRSVAYVQIRTVLIRDSFGKAVRAVASLMDVTDLVSKHKALEKQNAGLKEIAWMQSHVMRSPLACIMGLADMLKNKNEHGISEEKLIDEIQAAANKMDKVVHDIVRKAEAVEHVARIRE